MKNNKRKKNQALFAKVIYDMAKLSIKINLPKVLNHSDF